MPEGATSYLICAAHFGAPLLCFYALGFLSADVRVAVLARGGYLGRFCIFGLAGVFLHGWLYLGCHGGDKLPIGAANPPPLREDARKDRLNGR